MEGQSTDCLGQLPGLDSAGMDTGHFTMPPGDIGAWPLVWRAVWLLRRGALLAACRDLRCIRHWRAPYLEYIGTHVSNQILLNAMAEYRDNAYHPGDPCLDLAWGVFWARRPCLAHGETFHVRVAIVLGEEFDPDERLNVWIERCPGGQA